MSKKFSLNEGIGRKLKHGVLMAAFGAAGFFGTGAIYDPLASAPEPFVGNSETEVVVKYTKALSVITANQQALADTNDEDAAAALERMKKKFVTDTLLDVDLNEKDLAAIAPAFNALSSDDNITFSAYAYDARSMSKRNECLAVTSVGDDRTAAAQKLDTCMAALADQIDPQKQIAETLGGLLGGGLYASALAGYMIGRRRRPKAA